MFIIYAEPFTKQETETWTYRADHLKM